MLCISGLTTFVFDSLALGSLINVDTINDSTKFREKFEIPWHPQLGSKFCTVQCGPY